MILNAACGGGKLDAKRVFKIEPPALIFVMADIHFPFHDPQALRLALECFSQVVRSIPEDRRLYVALLGDIVDFHGISRFPKPPHRSSGFVSELYADRFLVQLLIEQLKSRSEGKARIIWALGNHEERLEYYLMGKAKELYDLDVLRVDQLLRVGSDVMVLRSSLLPGSREDRVQAEIDVCGRLILTHGHQFRNVNSSSAQVSPARLLYQRTGAQMIIGHLHRNDAYIFTDYRGKPHGFWVVGCLCLPRPNWDASRIWSQGIAIVDVWKSTHGETRFSVVHVPFIPDGENLEASFWGHTISVGPSRPPYELEWLWKMNPDEVTVPPGLWVDPIQKKGRRK